MASERQGAGTLFENPLSRCAEGQTFGLCFPSFFGLTPHSGKGRQARADIERMLDAKVFLELWVKVKEGWRNNQYQMRNFGYEDQ